jgi:type II secretory pathway component GspD/PulD (secretin)/tetratricopeptide (TPR) repeat protein
MRKVVKTSLIVLLICAPARFASAQADASQTAQEEAVRRQDAIIQLGQHLSDAKAAEAKGRFPEAGKAYEAAIALFPRLGQGDPKVEAQRAEVVAGFVKIRLSLARRAQEKADLGEADRQIKRALNVDPQNETVLALQRANDKAMLAAQGTIPTPGMVSRIPEFKAEKVRSYELVQDGRVLLDAGKLDEAEAHFKEAMALYPQNTAASYYLDIAKETRYKMDARRRDAGTKQDIENVEYSWVKSAKGEYLQIPNMYARTNLVYSSEGRRNIKAKLERIRLNEISFDGLPLVEVLKKLTEESIKRDPDRIGINFMINSKGESAPASTDPTAPPPTPLDLGTVPIKINPSLREIKLVNVLDAICMVADQPITYDIEDYAVTFIPKPQAAATLITKKFRVNPNTFVQGLQGVSVINLSFGAQTAGGGGGSTGGSPGGSGGGGSPGGSGGSGGTTTGGGFDLPVVTLAGTAQGAAGAAGGGGAAGGRGGVGGRGGLWGVTQTNSTLSLHEMVRDYFTAAGVNLDPPKSVFFNDRAGWLMVTATESDINTIREAIDLLNIAPPQVTIEAKFAEITQTDSKALGFDWAMGNTTFGGKSVGLNGGSASQYQSPITGSNPNGIFPFGLPPAGGSDIPGLVTSGLRNTVGGGSSGPPITVPEIANITGILTQPQFQVIIHALEQREGTDVLSAPSVTTESGRQAHIGVQDIITVVSSVTLSQTGASGTGVGGIGGASISSSVASQSSYNTVPFPSGPSLDVLPSISADEFSVQMVLLPTYTEFVGYDDPGQFIPQAQSVGGGTIGIPLTAQLPLPRLRLRQVVTSCNVWDGQTVFLGGLLGENINKIKDKVPMLGDLPFVGRLFRSESSQAVKENLMIFVTPTIVDPAGNRVHTDAELPFAQTNIPPQTLPVTPSVMPSILPSAVPGAPPR